MARRDPGCAYGQSQKVQTERASDQVEGIADDEDPCEIHFDDIRQVDGRSLPFHWTIRHGDDIFADIKISSYDWSAGKKTAAKEAKQ